MSILASQGAVIASTLLILALTLGLAYKMTRKYLSAKTESVLFWSLGLWAFGFGVFLEVLFGLGFYSDLLGGLYLFTVALLVNLLALGSICLLKSKRIKNVYLGFSIIAELFSAYAVASGSIGNILENYVAALNPPMMVLIASSVITFPAAIILVATAYLSYRKKKSYKLVSIILGVIVVSIAGTLYIDAFPAFLYWSEFIGILLLWIGFI